MTRPRLVLFLTVFALLAGWSWFVWHMGRTSAQRGAAAPPPPHSMKVSRPGLLFPKGSGKIAIVLDDWGYTMRQVPVLTAIRPPLTVAILPGLPHSAEVSEIARRSGHQVILHMPMEAMARSVSKEKDTLRTDMPPQEILQRLDRSLASVPNASGISNHQGSRATSDAGLMGIVLKETQRRGLFFLDSFVTQRSVCREVARRTGVPVARRDVFLDNEETPAAIQKQLVLLAQTAAKQGHAIGIGHDRPITLEALRKAVPALEKAGYTLVPVSELTEKAR